MENINLFLEYIWNIGIINSIIIIALSITLYKIIIFFLSKSEEKSRSKLFTSNKGKTYIRLIRSIIRYIFMIVTFLIVLQINGINVSSILAGVGILGVVFGLAIQDWLKDIIRGSSILSDEYFHVGDVVKYKNTEGKVLIIGLKTTKIQDLTTSNIISIANRNIEEIELVSKIIHVKIPMPYEVSLEKAENAIQDILELVKENANVISCRYIGVTEFAESSIEYLLEVECNQQFKLQVRRDTLREILVGLRKNKIKIPYKQIDIHSSNLNTGFF